MGESKSAPLIISTASDGEILFKLNDDVYSYWIDAALIPYIKKTSIKQPWKALNFTKQRCRQWEKKGDKK